MSEILSQRAALIIGHPGHELQVYNWVERTHPYVCILTDGSGRNQNSRLNSTTKILNSASAEIGSIYGCMTDIEVYAAIVNHNFSLFTNLVEELAQLLMQKKIDYVVGDSAEGYNPTHDVCRLLINTTVAILQKRQGFGLPNFDFSLTEGSNTCPDILQERAIWLHLDEQATLRKVATAEAYEELASEVQHKIKAKGIEPFKVECLRPVNFNDDSLYHFQGQPFYEQYGEKQVKRGYYDRVIRYQEHILPLIQAMKHYITRTY